MSDGEGSTLKRSLGVARSIASTIAKPSGLDDATQRNCHFCRALGESALYTVNSMVCLDSAFVARTRIVALAVCLPGVGSAM